MRFLTQISVEMTNIHQKPDNYEKIKFRRTEG